MKDRFKRRILISTLTMLCICSQLGNTTVMAMSNRDITGLINDIGHEVSIVIEEDIVQEQGTKAATKSKEQAKPKVTTKKANKKGTYSSDGRYYYGGYTGTEYKTTKYLSEQHPELKADLEEMFGADNLIFNDRTYRYNTSMWDVLGRTTSPVNKAINSKSMRLRLGTIGVENKLQKKNDYAASHLVPLFTYYGVINTDDGLLDYTHSTTNYLSRQQAALMLGRFMHPESYMMDSIDGSSKEDGLYSAYVAHYKGSMLLRDGKHGYTEKDLQAPMTRLEFIYMLMSYFPSDVKEAKLNKDSIVKIFSDIDKDDIVTEKWAQSKGLLDSEGFSKNDNQTFREMLKAKKIGMGGEDGSVEAAYNLGILKKDSKGRANLFKPITKSQAIRMLADAANAVAKDKSITYGN